MSEPSVSARVTRISSPMASPGNCGICGKSAHPDGFADAGLHFEFYGTLILCADCVGDFARLFGYLNPEKSTDIQTQLQDNKTEITTLREAVLLLESSVESLTAYNEFRGRALGSRVSTGGLIVEGEPEDSDDADGTVVSGETVQPAVTEPSNVAGPNDVHSTTSTKPATEPVPL